MPNSTPRIRRAPTQHAVRREVLFAFMVVGQVWRRRYGLALWDVYAATCSIIPSTSCTRAGMEPRSRSSRGGNDVLGEQFFGLKRTLVLR